MSEECSNTSINFSWSFFLNIWESHQCHLLRPKHAWLNTSSNFLTLHKHAHLRIVFSNQQEEILDRVGFLVFAWLRLKFLHSFTLKSERLKLSLDDICPCILNEFIFYVMITLNIHESGNGAMVCCLPSSWLTQLCSAVFLHSFFTTQILSIMAFAFCF